MANKYVDTSATYNGDGSASNQAASEGAAGAFNSLIETIDGTNSVSAGDTIYVRTADASGDLTETLSTNLVMDSIGGVGGVTNIVFDDGTIWANAGQFTLDVRAYKITYANYVNFAPKDSEYRYRFYAYVTGGSITSHSPGFNVFAFPTFESYYHSTSIAGSKFGFQTKTTTSMISPKMIIGCVYPNVSAAYCSLGAYSELYLINPEMIFNSDLTSANIRIFTLPTYSARLRVFGGSLTGMSDLQTVVYLSGDYAYDCLIQDFDIGDAIFADCPAASSETAINNAIGCNIGGIYNYTRTNNNSIIMWQSGKNYPTLNAVLPDASNTPWSFKVFPTYSNIGIPIMMPDIVKFYNQPADYLTITANFLASEDYTLVSKSFVYMSIVYTDTSGVKRSETSFEANNDSCESGSSGWSATIYGAKNYDPYKLSVTTQYEVAQNTEIFASIVIGLPQLSSNDFFFVDPEIDIQAA